MEAFFLTLTDFIPSGILLTSAIGYPAIDAISNATSVCYENSNTVALTNVLVGLMIIGSLLVTALSSLGVVIRPRYRYNLEGKVEWIPAVILGSLMQFFIQMYWLLLAHRSPLLCWIHIDHRDYVMYRAWQSLASIFIGGLLFGVIYLLNRKGIGVAIRGYDQIH